MKSAFEDFKAEALKRKTAVKNRKTSPKEFEDWIISLALIPAETCLSI